MGYDLHITRAKSWVENEGCEITLEEWLAVIKSDSELRHSETMSAVFEDENGIHEWYFVEWIKAEQPEEAWLAWDHLGNIRAKNPDDALIKKMVEIARKLNAKVQGDDGEVYDVSGGILLTDGNKAIRMRNGNNDEVPGMREHHEEDNLDQLYRDVIFEHYRRPHNKGIVAGAQIITTGNNPVCGDRVTVYGKVGADGRLEQVGFDGKGCAICMASSSMMTEAMRGKSLAEAGKLSDRFKAMLRSEEPFAVLENVPDMEALEGVRKFSVRVKCATLAWTALKNGILEFQAGKP